MKNEATIASKILAGSRQIDKMKSEIQQIVTIVLGLCGDSEVSNQTSHNTFLGEVFERTFESPLGKWKICKQLRQDGCPRGSVTIHCQVWVQGRNSKLLPTAYAFVEGRHCYPSPVCDVKLVHQSLSVFVEGMMREVPLLKRRLQMIADESVE